MGKILDFEDKVRRWIEQHRIKWIFILFTIGFSLGFFPSISLEAPIRQGIVYGLVYSFILVFVEITAGGSGIN